VRAKKCMPISQFIFHVFYQRGGASGDLIRLIAVLVFTITLPGIFYKTKGGEKYKSANGTCDVILQI